MNRIDSAIQDASRAVDRVASKYPGGMVGESAVPQFNQANVDYVDQVEQRRFSSRHPEGRMTAEESADSLVRSQSRGESQPAPKPKWSPDDRARAARQLERAVATFRRYAGREGGDQ